MPDSIFLLILGTLVFLSLSSFFSGLEAAYLAIDRVIINRLESSKSVFSKLVIYFSKNINYFLISLLTFNLFNNIMATLFASRLVEKILRFYEVGWLDDELMRTIIFDGVFVVIFTSIVLIFSELLPKRISIRHPQFITLIGSPFMTVICLLIFPSLRILSFFTGLFPKVFLKKNKNKISEEIFKREELIGYVERISKSEDFQELEGNLLKNILQYMNTPISSLLVNREKMEGINLKEVNGNNLFNIIKNFPTPYIVLYEQNKDNIMGLVTKKKIIHLRNLDRTKPQIFKEDLLKQAFLPIMIPESRNVLDVLQDIYYSKGDVAIITDEHGGIEGIVSQNDIVSRIFENFSEEEDKMIRLVKEENHLYYVVKTEVKLTTFNEFFKTKLYCEENETLNGYLLERIREIPKRGFEYFEQSHLFRVRARTQKKIISVEVVPISNKKEI